MEERDLTDREMNKTGPDELLIKPNATDLCMSDVHFINNGEIPFGSTLLFDPPPWPSFTTA
jgi:threonine dehydrogenase-like Zn-dependent dehydrogenase